MPCLSGDVSPAGGRTLTALWSSGRYSISISFAAVNMYFETESDGSSNASTLLCRIQHASTAHHNSRRSSIRQNTPMPHARSVWHDSTDLVGKQPSVSVCSHCLGGRQPSVSAPTLVHTTLQCLV